MQHFEQLVEVFKPQGALGVIDEAVGIDSTKLMLKQSRSCSPRDGRPGRRNRLRLPSEARKWAFGSTEQVTLQQIAVQLD
jgi:hypothetical protein